MEKQELEKRVVELVRETASMDNASLHMDLMDDVGLSSIDVMDLIAKCETIFSVKISARDLRKIYTVQDLADLIEIRQ